MNAIQEVTVRRGIRHVLHFTREENLPSILQHGLLPRTELAARQISCTVNDMERWDGARDASSLSISWPNYKLFYRFRQNNPGVRWVVLSFDPSRLFGLPCAFCQTNAASNLCRFVPIAERSTPEAFEAMFADQPGCPDRKVLGLSSVGPTDPQAEVLAFGTVPAEYIQCVMFEQEHPAGLAARLYPGVNCVVRRKAFRARGDDEHWRNPEPEWQEV